MLRQTIPRRFTSGPRAGLLFARGSVVDSRGKEYHLPQSTYDECASARRRRVTDNYVRENTIIDEKIGPAL
jgi:hypothetical protein